MGFAKEFLKNSLGVKMIDTYWQMVLSGGGGGGGDKPWDEMTWDDVIAATKNGKYRNFEIGAMKELDLGSEGIVHMQIVGIDVDDLADGSGKAPLTFISKELLKTKHRMNPALTPSAVPYDEGTGAIGGWGKCEMRTYLKTAIKPLIPENVRNAIKTVTKYSNICNVSGTLIYDQFSLDDVWIPSYREVGATSQWAEQNGAIYSFFSTNEQCIKVFVGSEAKWWWSLRSSDSSPTSFKGVDLAGSRGSSYAAKNEGGVALGFCL